MAWCLGTGAILPLSLDKILVGKSESDHLGDLGVDGRVTLKLILK
jgi:hypothetical protein